MIIQIRALGGYVEAMGHRVAVEQGGENEVKRRCLDTLAHRNVPPDEIIFQCSSASGRPPRPIEPTAASEAPTQPDRLPRVGAAPPPLRERKRR